MQQRLRYAPKYNKPESRFSSRLLEQDMPGVALSSRKAKDDKTFFTSERIMTYGTALVGGLAMNSEALKSELGNGRWALITVFLAASLFVICRHIDQKKAQSLNPKR